ncbi:sigma-70 family RNA polymerase sigma factor [bacterium]|nr:sigma-70 family RNA polymerase sigma factor [bacterium]
MRATEPFLISADEPNAVKNSEQAHMLSNPEKWVDHHGDYLFRYALLRLRNKQLAEEVVQETFLAALQSRNKFAGQSSERTWLIGILKHKVIDHFRKTSKEVPLEDPGTLGFESEEPFRRTGEWVGHWAEKAAPLDWQADAIKLLEQKEFREVLNQCLSSLPPRLAQVFVLREIEEMSAGEICQTLNITEANLWVMLHRSRMQLRRSLEVNYFRPKAEQRKAIN